MKLFKKLIAICLMAFFALSIVPATLAYNYHIVKPYDSYWGTSQARFGAYSSYWPPGQGFYNYVSPPIALHRYGHTYNYAYNTRWPTYATAGAYPARISNIYKPYTGWPAGWYGSQPWTYYKQYGAW